MTMNLIPVLLGECVDITHRYASYRKPVLNNFSTGPSMLLLFDVLINLKD